MSKLGDAITHTVLVQWIRLRVDSVKILGKKLKKKKKAFSNEPEEQ